MMTDRCATCGARLTGKGFTTFKCPQCGEAPVGRCAQCRDQSVRYLCTACGFEGP